MDVLVKVDNTDVFADNADIFAEYICRFFREFINSCNFPTIVKCANVTHVFDKSFCGSKEYYRLVIMLLVISKIFERVLCE